MLPLYEDAKPCVGSGMCCKKRPCPFGQVKSFTDSSCVHLKEVKSDGKYPRYTCGIYKEIIGKPGWEVSPAFGAGCCSSLFNRDRDAILREIASHDDPDAAIREHHRNDN